VCRVGFGDASFSLTELVMLGEVASIAIPTMALKVTATSQVILTSVP
jgi:hypothetical protein